MAKKQKKKATLFETVQFRDLKEAKRAVTYAKINQIRILIGFVLAVVATYLSYTGMTNQSDGALVAGGFLGFFSYIVGGGLGRAIKTAWNITKICWFMIPIFPLDLGLALLGGIFSLYGLMFVPVLFVGMNFIQHKKTLDTAKRYLAECRHNAAMAEE